MPNQKDAGFTLTEVVIATLLSSVVIGGALTAFNGGMQLADTTRIISETNQSLQAAMSLMVRDFIQTGQGIPTGGIPMPTGLGSVAVRRPGPNAGMTYPAAWTALPAITPGSNLGPTVLGVTTDIVSTMYADPTIALNTWPLTAIGPNGVSMTVDNRTSIAGADGLRVGDLILFSNANGNAIQTITRLGGGQVVFFDTNDANDGMRLNQPGAAQGTLVGLQSSPGVWPPTTATRITLISYYIDVITDPQLPRLVRRVSTGAQLAIALGMENLQLSYDLVDGTANPTNVPEPPVGNSANQIRKVNLFISARSLDMAPLPRNYVRNSMATEIGLRSLSFVDRYR